jgi:spermidine synthase
VKPFELLAETLSPDGTLMKLTRRGDEYFILADGLTLMSNRAHNSEDALARLSCQRARALKKPSVLIGGLGMGFTLRATLDLLPPAAKVVVAELVPEVVEWNRGPLGPLAGNPLSDKRVRVDIANVADILTSSSAQFDVVLLDVDNGPAAFTAEKNADLYAHEGIAGIHRALNPGGVLAVWAARQDPKFVQRLRNAGFEAKAHHVRGHTNNRGPRHTIYIGHKS